jgi:hypothetical protein
MNKTKVLLSVALATSLLFSSLTIAQNQSNKGVYKMATITTINNGESAGIVRSKINTNFSNLNTESALRGKKSERIVVGTSTSSWVSSNCDYLCDGTNDEVEINAAIVACATSGEIIILDGDYKISAPIAVSKNIKIKGSGDGTIFTRMYNSASSSGLFFVNSSTCFNAEFSNFFVEGNKGAYNSTNNNVIYASNVSEVKVHDVKMNNFGGIGIVCSSSLVNIYDNVFSNGLTGISLTSCVGSKIIGNYSNSCDKFISLSGCEAIIINSNLTIQDNYSIYASTCNYLTISSNQIFQNQNTGIYFNAVDRSIVSSNWITGATYSVRLNSTTNDYNYIATNFLYQADVSSGGGTGNTYTGLNKIG